MSLRPHCFPQTLHFLKLRLVQMRPLYNAAYLTPLPVRCLPRGNPRHLQVSHLNPLQASYLTVTND